VVLSYGVAEHRRDAGLVRAVGPWNLAASIINCVLGVSIFVGPAALARYVGVFAPLAVIVGAIAIGAVAICFAEAGSRVSTSGGAYGYVEAAFGPLPAYVTGTLQWVGDALGCGSITAALADMVVSSLPLPFAAPTRAVVIVGVIGGLASVNVAGVARAAKLVSGITLLKLIPVLVFLAVGAGAVHSVNFGAAALPNIEGLGRALMLILFALSGMETALCASGEVAQPARTVPRALAIAILSVTFLYVSVQFVAQGTLGPSLANSKAPLADAMAQISPTLRLVMVVGAAVSGFAFLGSNILGTPRMLFAFARDGLLPRVLGHVHPRHHSPHIAILTYSALVIGLALSGTFATLAVLSALASAALYMAGCAAAWRLARRRVAHAGEPLNFPWLFPAMVTGIASMLALIALASRAEIAGLTIVVAGSAMMFVLQTRLRATPN
jgi:basic amino acid/polyamine antiporter, APA family